VIPSRPTATPEDAERIARDRYGLDTSATELPAEFDRNFLLDAGDGRRFVLKISPRDAEPAVVRSQVAILDFLAGTELRGLFQRVRPALDGGRLIEDRVADGSTHLVRLLSYLEGFPASGMRRRSTGLLGELGATLARLDRELESFDHPGAHREHVWDLTRVLELARFLPFIEDPRRRRMIEALLDRFRSRVVPHLSQLRRGVIYNDANDDNLLVSSLDPETARLAGLIDFGDMVHTITVSEPVIAAAYMMLGADDPLANAAAVVSSYDAVHPLTVLERSLVFDLIVARWCASVLMSSEARSREPDNRYLLVSSEPVWRMLEGLPVEDHDAIAGRLAEALHGTPVHARRPEEIVNVRRRHLGPNLSISYRRPLKIVRGEGQYLFDDAGRRYLDLVNNVCHVGHCHPHVVASIQRQAALLNTNTRYLHDNLTEYIVRLTATFADPLSVCFLVCSGTEANDLALRLARAHTGRRDIVVLDHAYHGNSPSQIEISPYKCEGPGGEGLAPFARKVPMPDPYRGRHRGAGAGARYAALVAEAVVDTVTSTGGMGSFMAESLISCGGQIVPPPGFLAPSYAAVRTAGGVCIADEVQTGFGRVGSHMWAFELQEVVPDIVTLGKPIGNGHPLAAVITTPEIASSFDTGMEYFNTYGGNPVSCAAGLAVLDVIEREGLRQHAHAMGDRFIAGARELAERHPLIGDVRGAGLFIGIELVRDHDTLEPAAAQAGAIVEEMKGRGFLLSTDGPDHNVLKIKPPMVIQAKDIDATLQALDETIPEP